MPAIDQARINAANKRPDSVLSWTDNDGIMHAVFADIVTTFAVDLQGTLTKHPIQGGGSITDHFQPGARNVTFTLKHSRQPVYPDGVWVEKELQLEIQPSAARPMPGVFLANAIDSGVQSIFGTLSPLKVITLQGPENVDRIYDLMKELESAWLNAYEIAANVSNQVFEGYTITNVKMLLGPDHYGTFEIAAEQVTVVETSGSEQNLPKPSTLRMQPNKDKGKSSKQKLDEIEAKAAKKSLLRSGTDSIGLTG